MVEELPIGDGIGLIPEPAKVIFDAPRPAGPQLLFLQSIQFFLMFFTPHLVDAFVEMLRNMKAIEHNLGLRGMTGHAQIPFLNDILIFFETHSNQQPATKFIEEPDSAGEVRSCKTEDLRGRETQGGGSH